jgi:hypothetical protein
VTLYRWARWNGRPWQIVRTDGRSARMFSGASWPVADRRWTWGDWVPDQEVAGSNNFGEVPR